MSLRNVRILLLALIALEAALLIFGPQSRDHLPAIEAALAAKQKPEWWDDAAMGIRHAAWINGGLLILMLFTSKWWTRAFAKLQTSDYTSQARDYRWYWPLVVLAAITCLGLRLPLASKSLWWDEAWVMMQVSHGKWRPDAKHPGEFKFMAHDWKRCAFYYQKPTNHVPMSLLQKVSLLTWQKLTGAKRDDFSDLAARVPALLASCAAVVLLALLLRSWGRPGAGVTAAFLLALHPWHIRYGVDARAYALVVPLCIGGMFAVSRIWQSRGATLLPWICWGFIEFLWLWAYPNAVLDVAALNLLLAIILWRDKDARPTGLARLLVTNVFAAVALVQVFLPNMMQALHWAGNENVVQPVNVDLLKSTLSQLVFGVERMWPDSPDAKGLVSSTGAAALGFGWWTLPIMALMLLALVALRFRRPGKGPAEVWIIAATPLLSSMIFVAGKALTASYFYPRFAIAALPSLVALVAFLFAEAMADRNARRWIAGAITWFVLPCWSAQTKLLMARPYAPLRAVASSAEHLLKGLSAEQSSRPLLVCYGHGYEVMPVYHPDVQPALSRADLEKFIAQARAENRPLLVMQGHSVHNRALIPDGFTLLDDPATFKLEETLAGIEPEFFFRVFRLK